MNILLKQKTTPGNFPAPMSEHRDGSETAWQQAEISVNRCGQEACPERVRSGVRPGRHEFQNAEGSFPTANPWRLATVSAEPGPEASAFHSLQRSKPLSRAKALSDVSGRAPRCWITSAAANAPSRAASRYSAPRESPTR